MNDWRSLLARIGGPNALSWPQFWILFAVNAVVSLASNPDTFDGPLGPRLTLVAVSQLALFAPPAALWWWKIRTSPKPRPMLMFGGFLAGGVLRGSVLVLGSAVITGALPTAAEVTFRMTASISIMTIGFVISAISNDLTREYAESAAELSRVQADVAGVEAEVFDRMRANHRSVVAEIRAQLARLLNSHDPRALVEALRVSVDDVVRPLSHDLARTIPSRAEVVPAVSAPSLPWRALVREVARIDLFMPTATVLISFTSSLSWLLARFESTGAQLLMAAGLAICWLLMRLANLLWRRLALTSVATILTIGSVFAAAIGASWAVPFQIIGPEFGPMLAVSIGYYLLAAWMFALPRAADRLTRQHTYEVTEAIAQLEWELARAQASAWQQQRSFAYALHGPVQSALTACIFRLEGALGRGEVTEQLRVSVERDLSRVLDGVTETHERPAHVLEVVDEIRQLWDGIATVELECESGVAAQLANDATASAVLIDVTREACSNAVRHGRARQVFIRVELAADNLVELTIANDGTDVPSRTSAGLGTQLLSEATVSWSRSRRGPLTVLTALVPVAAPADVS